MATPAAHDRGLDGAAVWGTLIPSGQALRASIGMPC